VNTVINLRGSEKCWEILEWLSNWRLLKNGSAPWWRDSVPNMENMPRPAPKPLKITVFRCFFSLW
jgi:hypothetical protein